MSYTEKHIVDSGLLSGLSSAIKLELIDSLSKSLKTETDKKEANFYKSFGAFGSDDSAEEIIKNIKAARKFKLRTK